MKPLGLRSILLCVLFADVASLGGFRIGLGNHRSFCERIPHSQGGGKRCYCGGNSSMVIGPDDSVTMSEAANCVGFCRTRIAPNTIKYNMVIASWVWSPPVRFFWRSLQRYWGAGLCLKYNSAGEFVIQLRELVVAAYTSGTNCTELPREHLWSELQNVNELGGNPRNRWNWTISLGNSWRFLPAIASSVFDVALDFFLFSADSVQWLVTRVAIFQQLVDGAMMRFVSDVMMRHPGSWLSSSFQTVKSIGGEMRSVLGSWDARWLPWLLVKCFFHTLIMLSILIGLIIVLALAVLFVLVVKFVLPLALIDKSRECPPCICIGCLLLLQSFLIYLPMLIIDFFFLFVPAGLVVLEVLMFVPVSMYLYVMHSADLILCIRAELAYHLGNMPELAGPVAGISVILIGYLVYRWKVRQKVIRVARRRGYELGVFTQRVDEFKEEVVEKMKANGDPMHPYTFEKDDDYEINDLLGSIGSPTHSLIQVGFQFEKEKPEDLLKITMDYVRRCLTWDWHGLYLQIEVPKHRSDLESLIKNQKELTAVHFYFGLELKPGSVQQDESKQAPCLAPINFVRSKVKTIIPCFDNYSDTSQSINFLGNGQPFFFCMNGLGIFWNIYENICYNQPANLLDTIGRVFQSDVIEVTAQVLRTGSETWYFHEKKAIQARTENVMNTPVLLFVILHIGEIGEDPLLPGLGALAREHGFGAWSRTLEFAACFILVVGIPGTLASLFTSMLGLYDGLCNAPQWVEAFKVAERKGGHVSKEFKPNRRVSLLIFCECIAIFGTGVAATFYLTYVEIYLGFALVSLIAGWRLPYMKVHMRKHAKAKMDTQKSPWATDVGREVTSYIFLTVSWFLNPWVYVWPQHELPLLGEDFKCSIELQSTGASAPRSYMRLPDTDSIGPLTDTTDEVHGPPSISDCFKFYFGVRSTVLWCVWFLMICNVSEEMRPAHRAYSTISTVWRRVRSQEWPIYIVDAMPLVQGFLLLLSLLATLLLPLLALLVLRGTSSAVEFIELCKDGSRAQVPEGMKGLYKRDPRTAWDSLKKLSESHVYRHEKSKRAILYDNSKKRWKLELNGVTFVSPDQASRGRLNAPEPPAGWWKDETEQAHYLLMVYADESDWVDVIEPVVEKIEGVQDMYAEVADIAEVGAEAQGNCVVL